MASKGLAAAAALIFLGASCVGAAAQSRYPDRPVTIVVPAAAGGPSDTVARLVAQAMTPTLGQQMVIENKGGAGGSLGAGDVAKAAPDGYTLLLYHIGVATFAPLYPKLPYKPEEFSPVGLVTEVPMVLVGRSDLRANSMPELLALLKEKGPALTIGTAGVGSVSHLCALLLANATGAKFVDVPYKGSGPAMLDLVGKRIDLMCDQTTNTVNQIKAGDIKAFGVTTRARIAVLPAVPTLNESGLKGFEITAWHALWAPKGTPEPIRMTLSAALQKALKDPTVIDRMASLGTVPVPDDLATPAALDRQFRSEIARLGKLLAAVAPN
ncbi:tripartite tricarboxylate transporter substrate-binding protein [Aquabacter spiritensis]|uniref:Tripartite-type tricarboxylate transporter receptor subunit TctC n=1 Tax=Aquabacter spiritensis TaxID=933073 RepID=A0A4R3M1K3_9HYPH|nr:tripartite tricarboxylate transporter substrate-binding protein [Aquabacter spiritensis]TCT04985.1 tripartite-type tricarboxylate transporter receptor subunit TctC [Aquabacter spiritensis]